MGFSAPDHDDLVKMQRKPFSRLTAVICKFNIKGVFGMTVDNRSLRACKQIVSGQVHDQFDYITKLCHSRHLFFT